MNQVDPEVLKRLDALMSKLGVGAGEAWRILIHQAYAEAISYIPWVLLWGFGIGLSCVLLQKCRGKFKEDDTWSVGIGLCCLVLFVCLCGIAANVSDVCVILINPEGYALQKLLTEVK